MKINIHDLRRIADIQEEFNTAFPYLKIEFFSKKHSINEGLAKRYVIDVSETLGKFRTLHNSGDIVISPEMKVMDIEQLFNDIYGLSIQIFRKSGKVWLETTVTDGWTLEKQNAQGEELSKAAD
jgi:hypothetical protein